MKEFVLEATTDVPAPAGPLALRERLGAFAELTKPRITFLIVLTSAAGFCLGSKGGFDYLALFNSLFGIAPGNAPTTVERDVRVLSGV